MNKLELIQQATNEILSTCPNWEQKIYLLEDYTYGMTHIQVTYDTHATECKTLYFDKNGIYLKGRSQSQGDKTKIYLHEFNGFTMDDATSLKIEQQKLEELKDLDTRIPSKDIQVGMICREYSKHKGCARHMAYLGKARHITTDNKDNLVNEEFLNIYGKMNESFDKVVYFESEKNKIRFDKVEKAISVTKIIELQSQYKEEVESWGYGHYFKTEVVFLD